MGSWRLGWRGRSGLKWWMEKELDRRPRTQRAKRRHEGNDDRDKAEEELRMELEEPERNYLNMQILNDLGAKKLDKTSE